MDLEEEGQKSQERVSEVSSLLDWANTFRDGPIALLSP
jgi:hypothetical protein